MSEVAETDTAQASGIPPNVNVPEDSQWLHVHHDPVAGINALTSGLALTDLTDSGDSRLLIAHLGNGVDASTRMLKVYRGGTVVSNSPLKEMPTGIVAFYMTGELKRVPAVAVASGASVFVYKNLKPFFKFTLPTMDIDSKESDAWAHAYSSPELDLEEFHHMLDHFRQTGSQLSPQSLEFLSLEPSLRSDYVNAFRDVPVTRHTVITCIGTINKSGIDFDDIACIVLATEACKIYVLNSTNFGVMAKFTLPSPATMMSISGQFESEFRIVVGCRDGCIYTIKEGGEFASQGIQLPSQAVGLMRVNKTITVGCMDGCLYGYSTKGKRLWCLQMPAAINTLDAMHHRARNWKGVAVALANGDVRIYQDRNLVSVIKLHSPAVALKFGRFGKDDGTLVLVLASGDLVVKALKRTALMNDAEYIAGPPAEQFVKIKVPPKTQLYLEQTQRERENCIHMHRIFQRDMTVLRLQAARLYVKALTGGLAPVINSSRVSLKFNVEVRGIGPVFKIVATVQNTSPEALTKISMSFATDPSFYTIHTRVIKLPLLVPGVNYDFSTFVQVVTEAPVASVINVFVTHENSPVPCMTAIVNMPISEGLTTVR